MILSADSDFIVLILILLYIMYTFFFLDSLKMSEIFKVVVERVGYTRFL